MNCGVPKYAQQVPAFARPTVALVFALAAVTAALGAPGGLSPFPSARSNPTWPLFFEAVPAQNGAPAKFLARGPNYQLIVAPSEVNFVLRKPARTLPESSVRRDQSLQVRSAPARFVRMEFTGANLQAGLCGAEEMGAKINYLIGNTPAQWRTGVRMFAKATVQALYPGVDLVYYGNHRQLEYDFTIAPKTDPSVIVMRFDGVDSLAVSRDGELVVGLGDAQLRQPPPVVYQMVRGVRHEIAGAYRLKDPRAISFSLGPYDHDLPLVIDPMFSYATYFGGNGGDTGLAVKVDNSGSVYLAGETLSTQFPSPMVTNAFQSTMHGGSVTGDAFIAKLDNTGSKLIYFTYLGGSSDDGAYDLALDTAGNAYVTGFTVSPDFPTKNALFSQISGSSDPTFHIYPVDAFVAELNTNGSSLIYSTYLGGTGNDLGSAIAVDPAGNAYVTGYTYSTNFPVLNALQGSLAGTDDAFIAKLAPGGSNLIYSTYFGGVGIDEGEGIAADAAGFAYVAGYTTSTDFPITPNASQTNLNGSGSANGVYDAFVSRIAPNGAGLVYSTYLGGSQNDFAYRIAVDSLQNAYVTGTTQSPDFPRTNSFNLARGEDGTNAINFDAFLTKISPNGTTAYSTQFGGTANDAGWDVALDPSGRAFVIGITLSTNFPVVSPFDLFRTTNSGGTDVFVTAFDTNAVLYSAYLGGTANDYGYAIAVDAEANAYISGMTFSSAFPITAGAFEGALTGSSGAFLAKIRLNNPTLKIVNTTDALQLTWPATAPDYLLQSTPNLLPRIWANVPPPVPTNGEYLLSRPSTNTSTLFRLHRP